MNNKQDNQVVVTRLPKHLLKKVDTAARKNFRTRSAEMRARLEESFAATPPAKQPVAA